MESKEQDQSIDSVSQRSGDGVGSKCDTHSLATIETIQMLADGEVSSRVVSRQALSLALSNSSILVGNSATSVLEQKIGSNSQGKKKKRQKNAAEVQFTQYIAPDIFFAASGRIRAWHVHNKSGKGASAKMEMQVWRPVGFDK